MITGDKPKTAVEIGKTTGIINPLIPEENILFLEGRSKREVWLSRTSSVHSCWRSLTSPLRMFNKRNPLFLLLSVYDSFYSSSFLLAEEQEEVDSSLFSLIITGYTLVYILEKYSRKDIKSFKLLHEKNNYKDVDVDNNEEDLSILLYIKFYTLCTLMDSIVCCRVTPKQKVSLFSLAWRTRLILSTLWIPIAKIFAWLLVMVVMMWIWFKLLVLVLVLKEKRANRYSSNAFVANS